jgi:hypothetical protein
MRLDLTSPHDQSIKATVVISDLTGQCTVESGEGDDLFAACVDASEAVHGGIEPWVPPLDYLVNWALARGIHVAEHNEPPRTEVDPDVDY